MSDENLSNSDVYRLLSAASPSPRASESDTAVITPTAEDKPSEEQKPLVVAEPLGREAAFLVPWSDDEKRAFQAHARSLSRNAESMSDAESVDWLRRHRGLPQILRPEQPSMKWELGQYGGRKTIRDFEDESRTLDSNSFQGVERPGSKNLNGRGA